MVLSALHLQALKAREAYPADASETACHPHYLHPGFAPAQPARETAAAAAECYHLCPVRKAQGLPIAAVQCQPVDALHYLLKTHGDRLQMRALAAAGPGCRKGY